MVGAWKRWSGALALASERDFERLSLPFLRILWPAIDQSPPKKGWDSKGVDLLVLSEVSRLPCAVQCKGFVVQDIGPDQTLQVRRSVQKFSQSGLLVDTYLVLHNRSGSNPEFRREITSMLQQIEESGQALRAELWDRHKLLSICRSRLEERIADGLHERAEELSEYYSNFFLHGSTLLRTVPVTESRLRFRRFEPCTVAPIASCSRSVSDLILSPTEARWTLLTGTFGAGKTTTVLQAAASKASAPVFIECRLLPALSNQLNSTSVLLEESLKTLRIFDEFSDADRQIIYEVSGTTFKVMLKRPGTKFVVILDGLDENRFYSHQRGMEFLSNQLAELVCPIVLTTRLEHLNAMFGDFSAAFLEFSVKYAPKRDARLVQLDPWSIDQAISLCDLVVYELKGIQRTRLQEFRKLLFNSAFRGFYGDLPSNPLMLRFILDNVIESGVHETTRTLLLDSWMRRKIRRDRRALQRDSLNDNLDLEDFVDQIMTVMQMAAGRMFVLSDGHVELEETVPEGVIKEIVSSVFPGAQESPLGLALNSFLLPSGQARTRGRSFAFAFRIVQEYLLARYLKSTGISLDEFPATVQELLREIAV